MWKFFPRVGWCVMSLRLEESPGFTESGGVGTLPDGVIKGGVGRLLNVIGTLNIILEGVVESLETYDVSLNHAGHTGVRLTDWFTVPLRRLLFVDAAGVDFPFGGASS